MISISSHLQLPINVAAIANKSALMPAISSPVTSTVLVTGSNGFIASWIVDDLLRAGYIVHAAVRTEERGANLKEMY